MTVGVMDSRLGGYRQLPEYTSPFDGAAGARKMREPTPPQLVFLCENMNHQVLEAMYGGAAGGGKSDALLLGALQYVDEPTYAALLLRKTYKDLSLPDALIPRSHEWLSGTSARWDGNSYTWHFPSGATLTFGYLATDKDAYQYQGAAFQYVGFDELTHFTEWQYTYLFSRARRGTSAGHIPIRVRASSNPGGVGHAWVKRRFIDEQGWVENEDGTKHYRTFVPARLTDNPHLDAVAYRAALQQLDPITRAQLLDGDWEARRTGNMFSADYFGQPIDISELPSGLQVVRYWDLAGTEATGTNDPDYTAGALVGTHKDTGTWYLIDMVRFRESPGKTRELVKQTAARDGKKVRIYIEQEGGQSGKAQIVDYQTHLEGYTVIGQRVSQIGDKVTRAEPLSARAQNGLVRLVRGKWVSAFLDEAELFPHPRVHDDQVDAFSGGYQAMTRARPVKVSNRMPTYNEPVTRIGDLVLKGREYIDADPSAPAPRRAARRSYR